ncbi:flavin reductase family protein [Prauserella flavalba]|uniref:flavin reductase family protein n=1 Tax=Prauserella flavalba TaxID=1477506 RepID=UPI0036EE8824
MAFVDDVIATYGDRVSIVPEDECGLLPIPEILRRLPSGWAVYCCGPEPLIAAVEQVCSTRSDLVLKRERFMPVTVEASANAVDEFTVVLARSAVEVQVKRGESLLEALEAAGIDVGQDCREGICGACETKVVSGEPDHRDSILTAEEKAICSTMFICVSGSKSSKLVLDL